MGAKIVAFLFTMTVCITAAVISMSVLVIAMNGYQASDATWGLGTFVVLAFLASLLSSAGAIILSSKLIARQSSISRSLLIAVPVFSFIGSGLILASALIGIGVAEFVRVNF